MPTWFLHKSKIIKFSEDGQGTPEDLLFFYAHLAGGGSVLRVDQDLLLYRYHVSNTTFSIKADTIWHHRLEEFLSAVLNKVSSTFMAIDLTFDNVCSKVTWSKI